MKTAKKLMMIIAILIISNLLNAQTSWNYISPVPGSKYINPENNIAFRHGEVLDISTIRSEAITVSSESKGRIRGNFILSQDMRTLIFHPDEHFALKDKVHVKLEKGIRTESGLIMDGAEFSFSVKEVDNTQMLIEYYERQSKEEMASIKTSGNKSHNEFFDTENYNSQDYPERFPIPHIGEFNNPSPGYIFCGPRPMGAAPYDPYLVIMDNYGTPVFYRNWPRRTNDFKMVVNNQLAFCDFDNANPSINKYIILNSHFEITDTLVMGNGYDLDQHDLLLLENGDHFLMAYDPQLVNMDTVYPGGNTSATVVGFIIQKLDASHNVIFQWRSWDHFDILDANHTDFTASQVDYVHGNAFEFDDDGNLLMSCRNMEEITKIDLVNGEIIWRFGLHAKNNMFTFINDTTGFSWQHDIRRIENGNITVYDNGNYHAPPFSQAVEYHLDEENFTAELVWNYIHDPVVFGRATGSHRRLDNGNAFICWGLTWPVNASEVTMDNDLAWELNWPENVWEYRVFKFSWEMDYFTANYDTIDFGVYDDYIAWPRIFTITNNADHDIQITSTHNHWDSYYVSTSLPLTIPANGTANMTVNFFPVQQGQINDVLTLNYESMYLDSLPQCISRQIFLTGFVEDNLAPEAELSPADQATEVSQLVRPVISFDEPVVKAGGGVITKEDIDDIIVFKEGDETGEDVAYTAFIDAWKTKITITPDTLKPLTSYYLELKAGVVQDNEGNVLSQAVSALWETEEEQGIDENELSGVKVFPNPTNGIMYVQFEREIPLRIEVINMNGERILTLNDPADAITGINLLKQPAGIYILMVFDLNEEPSSMKIVRQ
ncbi:MAG: aryl-sulfate sulfotransferase [Bacteroidales bacterium]|nr:aryl-sulfate sulfotransferase [Bacteroidales bacterium]